MAVSSMFLFPQTFRVHVIIFVVFVCLFWWMASIQKGCLDLPYQIQLHDVWLILKAACCAAHS